MTARRVPPGPSAATALAGMMIPRGDLASIPSFLERTAREYGPVSSWRLPNGRMWLFDDPALIDQLLTTSGYDVVKGRGLQRLRRVLGEGLVTGEEPLHLRQRRLVQPAFHRERIAGYATTMIATTAQAADELRDGDTVAIDGLMNRVSLRIAAATLFSADVDDDDDEIGAAVTEGTEVFPAFLGPFGELLDLIPFHPATRRFKRARARLDAVIFRVIEERRRSGGDQGDLLSILLSARDEAGRPMPDRLVRDEVLTLLLAGHETTANALSWAWDALARNPAAEAALHAELDDVLGSHDPTPSDAARLPVTRAVVAETLRLRPPAWTVGRQVIRPIRLGAWELPPGSMAVAAQIVTHRNPAWWREPEAFRPERWSNGETAELPRCAYFPFGGGTRMCIGEGFAWAVGILVLATLARRFRFRALDLSPVPLDPLVTLRPRRAIRMRVEARTQRSVVSV